MSRPVHRLKSQTFRDSAWEHIRARHPNATEELLAIARARNKRISCYTMYCGASFESGGEPWLDYVDRNENLEWVDCEECKEEYGLFLLAESDDKL